ncbi:MAG: hypothetical protein AAF290_02865 [Pseudomonadota bacterium]
MLDAKAEARVLVKKLVRYAIFDAIGVGLVVLAIYAKISGPEGVFHPRLADQTVLSGMLGFGIALAGWAIFNLLRCIRELQSLARQHSERPS